LPIRQHEASLANFLAHFSFAFGVLPDFATRTPLPDWSIGLEAQFYFVFPFLMLLALRFGYRKTVSIVSTVSFLTVLSSPSYFHGFAMPACLPLRLYAFGMGMLIGARMHSAVGRVWPILIALPLAAHFIVPGVDVKAAIAQTVLAVCFLGITQKQVGFWHTLIVPARRFLRHGIIQKLGLFSYSIYLLHLLVLLPMGAALLQHEWFVKSTPVVRLLTLFSASAIIVVPIASLLYMFVEKPGVRLGKWVLAKCVPGVSRSVGAVSRNQGPEIESAGVSAP
jgi:peptidoglycan/LPS O-acetylase OafA/YrhL